MKKTTPKYTVYHHLRVNYHQAITQKELAAKFRSMGYPTLNEMAIRKIETSQRGVTVFEMGAYIEFFNTTSDYLLGFTKYSGKDSNNIIDEIGLSDKAIRLLKHWNQDYKKYGKWFFGFSLDSLNNLLDFYYDEYIEYSRQGIEPMELTIFTYLKQYLFGNYKKDPVKAMYQTESNKKACEFKSGCTIDGKKVTNVYMTNESTVWHPENNDDLILINSDTNTPEFFPLDHLVESVSRESIYKELARIKNKIKDKYQE